MPNLYNASIYKNKVLDILMKDENFVKLINPHESPHPKILEKEVLLGGTFWIDGRKYEEQGYIFDHNFVDDTTTDEKTFAFVETTDINLLKNGMFTEFILYVCLFTGKPLVRITNNTSPTINEVEEMGYDVGYFGNRIDILCDIVDRAINQNKKIKGIGDIKPLDRGYCSLFIPNQKFYGKCLKYHISNLNETMGDRCEN